MVVLTFFQRTINKKLSRFLFIKEYKGYLARRLAMALFFCWGFTLPFSKVYGEGIPCTCPRLECDVCHEEQGLSFYTEKCGPNLESVRSCAKPNCVVKKNPDQECSNGAISKTSKVNEASAVALKENQGDRKANFIAKKNVGKVRVLEGNAWVRRGYVPFEKNDIAFENKKNSPQTKSAGDEKIDLGTEIFEADTIYSDHQGRVKIEFDDGNIVLLQKDSSIKIDKYELEETKRQALIELIKGQIRNQVKKKYNGQTTKYEVHTKNAVAGVRGTDFIVNYNESDQLKTDVITLLGAVQLSDSKSKESQRVESGYQASYIERNGNEPTNVLESNGNLTAGVWTAVVKVDSKGLDSLKLKTSIESSDGGQNRQVASLKPKHNICNQPSGALNDCFWKCVHNPPNESKCRLDLSEVQCLRKRCNANGDWAEETKVPASQGEKCPGQGVHISTCNY